MTTPTILSDEDMTTGFVLAADAASVGEARAILREQMWEQWGLRVSGHVRPLTPRLRTYKIKDDGESMVRCGPQDADATAAEWWCFDLSAADID